MAAPHPLATTELLELILSKLPPRDLLLAQRVCKKWNALIRTSPLLQSLLFFRAPLADSPPPSGSGYVLNPLLEEALPLFFHPTDKDAIFSAQTRFGPPGEFAKENRSAHETWERYGGVAMFTLSAFAQHGEKWKRREASWRHMHLTHPAITTAVFRTNSMGMAGESTQESVVRFPSPPTLPPSFQTPSSETSDGKITLINGNGEAEASHPEAGLRMGVLYDYLQDRFCTGAIPADYALYFVRGSYPPHSYVAAQVQQGRHLGLEALASGRWEGGHGEEGEQADEQGQGENQVKAREAALTMLLSLSYTSSCVDEEDTHYPQFASEAFRRVEVGPTRTIMSRMWD